MIRAIFFDVDGTLLSHITRRIPHDTEQILMRLKEHGIKIFMSTGRHPAELLKLPVNNIKFDGYITLNGQLCLDDMGHIVFGTPFNKEITDKLVAFFECKKHPLALIEAERIYINFIDDTVCRAQESVSTPVPEIASYENGLIYQATTFLKRQEEPLLEVYLPPGCKFARWSDVGVDIISAEGGKAKGIEYFCHLYGIRQDEVMAFGDAENDMDMLKFAQIGVAMGNAHDCVKEIADYVTSDVDQGGIKNAIEHFQIVP